jgi:hypothetical protein
MKNLILTLFSFLFFQLFLIFFGGCSADNNIISPNNSVNSTNLFEKRLSAPHNSPDTMIFLPLSKKNIAVSKDLKANQIEMLDKYFTTHEITPPPQVITPNLQQCNIHDITGWSYGDKYRPVAGKYLGIWPSQDVVTYSKAFNNYGFSKVAVSSSVEISNAYINGTGFNYINMMYILNPNVSQQTINTLKTQGIGSFYIDEPFDHENSGWTFAICNSMAQYTSPNKLLVGSYHWPEFVAVINPFYYGTSYSGFIDAFSNTYIMCDEYHGNCCGTVDQYWSEFNNYYLQSKNITNWLSVSANNGDGNTHVDCPYINSVSNNWYDMLGHANRTGMNEVWLYANATGSETGVQNFCYNAWELGWLLRQYQQVVVIWKCSDIPACEECLWNNYGNWYVSGSYYTGIEQYVAY